MTTGSADQLLQWHIGRARAVPLLAVVVVTVLFFAWWSGPRVEV